MKFFFITYFWCLCIPFVLHVKGGEKWRKKEWEIVEKKKIKDIVISGSFWKLWWKLCLFYFYMLKLMKNGEIVVSDEGECCFGCHWCQHTCVDLFFHTFWYIVNNIFLCVSPHRQLWLCTLDNMFWYPIYLYSYVHDFISLVRLIYLFGNSIY